LDQAIKKEPNNANLYRVLGDVYNNLFTTVLEDTVQARDQRAPKLKEYGDMAKKNYKLAIEKDPTNVDFNYSMGALLYNETNIIAQEMNATSFATKDGQKRYAELKAQMLVGVDEALKYFQKAESLDPSDQNVLAALLQAYGRKEDDQLYMVFKKRLDVVKKGGKNTEAYFKN
jgi:tetratricopeptide (TPR) repeat protein